MTSVCFRSQNTLQLFRRRCFTPIKSVTELIAWCIMPNHVHVIVEQMPGWRLSDIVQAWKGTSAHEINRSAARKGRLWRREYFDRFMRDDAHLATTVEYVECNPVSAGLVKLANAWPWSSAHLRAEELAGEDAGGPR